MPDYTQYFRRQEQIYAEFRSRMASIERLSATPYVAQPIAGYLVAWSHPAQVIEKLARVNLRINKLVACLRIDQSNAHTTLSTYHSQALETFSLQSELLEGLAAACKKLDPALLSAVRIDFQEWLFNEDTLIAAGQPNQAFWEAGEALISAGQALGLQFRMPWGAHITAARFFEPAEKAQELAKVLLQMPCLGVSQPEAVFAGHFICSQRGLRLEKQFCLPIPGLQPDYFKAAKGIEENTP